MERPRSVLSSQKKSLLGNCLYIVIQNTRPIFYSRFSYIFWVDASSYDSITMCLKGISRIPAAQTFGVDGSVNSVLEWMSCIEEEWLIVFDNADNPSPEEVEEFIPSGNRGNILITSRNPSMGRLVSHENIIEIKEMEESDAISLLLKASHIDASPEHKKAAKRLVIELGCIPLAVEHAGAYMLLESPVSINI